MRCAARPRKSRVEVAARSIVDFDASRELPIHLEDVYVSMEKGQVAPELARARRAWQVIHDSKAYRMRVLSAP